MPVSASDILKEFDKKKKSKVSAEDILAEFDVKKKGVSLSDVGAKAYVGGGETSPTSTSPLKSTSESGSGNNGIPFSLQKPSSFQYIPGVTARFGETREQAESRTNKELEILRANKESYDNETPEDKFKKAGVNVTFTKPVPKTFSLNPQQESFNKLPSIFDIPNEPEYIDLSDNEQISKLSRKLDEAAKVQVAIDFERNLTKTGGILNTRKQLENIYNPILVEAKSKIVDDVKNNVFKKILGDRGGAGEVTSEDLLEAGIEFNKALEPSHYDKVKFAQTDGGGVGEEQSYNLQLTGADILFNKGGDDVKQKVAEKVSKLDEEHPKYMLAVAMDIVGAYNHERDNIANNGIIRNKPTYGLLRKWAATPEFRERFNGSEGALKALDNHIASLPDVSLVNSSEVTDVAVEGIFNKFSQSVLGTAENIGNLFRSDESRMRSLLNPTLVRGSITGNTNKVGQSAAIKQKVSDFERRLSGGEILSEEDKAQYESAKKSVDVTTDFGDFASGTGDLTGQVFAQYLITRGVGAASAPLANSLGGLSKAAYGFSQGVTKFPTFVNAGVATALNSYDGAQAQAVYNFPNDKVKQKAYASAMVAANIFTERIFKDEKIFQSFSKDFSNNLLRTISKLSNGEISRDVIKNTILQTAKKYGANTFIEGNKDATEEAFTQLIDESLQGAMGAPDYDSQKAMDNVFNTYKTTLLHGLPTAFLAGRTNVKSQKFNRVLFSEMAANPKQYEQIIKDLHVAGEMTAQERNEKISILNTAHEVLLETPPKVLEQGETAVAEYLVHKVNTRIKEDELSRAKDENYKRDIQEKINASKKNEKDVYDGKPQITPDENYWKELLANAKNADEIEAIEEQKKDWEAEVAATGRDLKVENAVPTLTTEQIESDLSTSLPKDKVKDATNFITEMVEGEILPTSYSETAKSAPLAFLQSVADQSYGITRDGQGNPQKAADGKIPDVTGQYTETVVKYAQSLFPATQNVPRTTTPFGFVAAESQFEALQRLTDGIEILPKYIQAAEIESRAKAHDESYQSFLQGENALSKENAKAKRVTDFGGLTTKAMNEFLVNPKKYADNKGDFENGSRIDENRKVITENDFVTLKQKVQELRKNGDDAEIAKINAAPRAYLEALTPTPVIEGKTTDVVVDALKDVESTANALNELDKNPDERKLYPLLSLTPNKYFAEANNNRFNAESISDAYHDAKKDGGNPELVKAVEDLLVPKKESTLVVVDEGVQPKISSNDTWRDVYRKIDNDLLRMPIDEVLPFIEESRNFINSSKDAQAKEQYLDKLKVQEAAAKEELKLKEAAIKSGRSYLEPNSWNAPNYDGNADTYGHVTSSKALYDIIFGNGELDVNFTQDGKLVYLNKGGEGQAARIRINGTFGLANLIFDAKALKEAGIEIHKGIEAHTRENIPLKYLTEKSKKAVLDHVLNEMDRRGEKPTSEQMQKIAESIGFDNWNNMQEALKNVKSGLEQSLSTKPKGGVVVDEGVGGKSKKEIADIVSNEIGGKPVGSVTTNKAEPKDIDIRVDGEYGKEQTDAKMDGLGYKWVGSSSLSPKEMKLQPDKKFGDGWQRIEHFEDSKGNKIDVWHDDNTELIGKEQSLSTKPEIKPKSLKQLESENKRTLPKVPAQNVFKNEVGNLTREQRGNAYDFIGTEKEKDLPTESISVNDIVPTQKNLTIPNLEQVSKIKGEVVEPIILIKHGDKYYVADGHHRIADAILKGENAIDAKIYDSKPEVKDKAGEQKADIQNKTVNLQSNETASQNISGKEGKSPSNNTQPSGEESPEKLQQRYKRVIDEVDLTDPYDRTLDYFANGGKIHSSAIEELFGGKDKRIHWKSSTENERRAKIQLLDKDGLSLSKLGETLSNRDPKEENDSQVYINAIEDVLLNHNSKSAMQQELVDKYDWEAAQKKYQEQRLGQEAIDIVESMTEDEVNRLLELDAEENSQQKITDYVDGLQNKPARDFESEKARLIEQRDEAIVEAMKPKLKPLNYTYEGAIGNVEKVKQFKQKNREAVEVFKKLKAITECIWQKK